MDPMEGHLVELAVGVLSGGASGSRRRAVVRATWFHYAHTSIAARFVVRCGGLSSKDATFAEVRTHSPVRRKVAIHRV